MRGDDGHRCCGLYDIVRILQVCRKKNATNSGKKYVGCCFYLPNLGNVQCHAVTNEQIIMSGKLSYVIC